MRLTTLVVLLIVMSVLGAACVPVTLTPPAAPAVPTSSIAPATVPPAAAQLPASPTAPATPALAATQPPASPTAPATPAPAATQPPASPAPPATMLPVATQPPAQAAAGTSSLSGTSWVAATLNGQPILAGTDVTLNLSADGKATGSDGCNSYNTTYTADASTISFKQPIASTMMACPDQIMNQANAYIKALGAAATYTANAKSLTLSDASGKALVTFTTQSNALGGTSWQVVSYNNGKQAVVSVAVGTTMTADFSQDGTLSGNAGCNDYSAAYTTTGTKMTVGPVAATRKMCSDPAGVMDQEQAYLAALPTAATYNIDGKKLELRTADGALVASFTAQASTGLAGTSWEAMGYNNGKQAVVSVMPGTTITANFSQDGNLTGNAGCNDYSASYQTAGDKITIGPAAATRKMCSDPAGVMDQEQAYLAALTTAATYTINGGKLELRTADGALVADFNKASSSGLAGTTWDALGYNNGKQAVVSPIVGTTITAVFGQDGSLTGNAGCNDYSATYQASGDKIGIGPAITTRKACETPQGVMDQEQAYLTALSTAATYTISGGKLELRTSGGALAADFAKAQP